MKKIVAAVLAVVLAASLVVVGVSVYRMQIHDYPAEEQHGTGTSSTQQATSLEHKVAAELLEINDVGEINLGSGFGFYDLRKTIRILQENNIAITEIKGASNASFGDGGSLNFSHTDWDYSFYEQSDALYDTEALDRSVQQQEIEAIYVKTQFEIITFRQSMGYPGRIYPIDDFHSNVVVRTSPRFVTEKGISIGMSFEAAASVHGFSEDDIIKISDSDWSAMVELSSDAFILLKGTKNGIVSIELGGRYACSL